MTKTNKKHQSNITRVFYATQPWKNVHQSGESEVTAYVEASGKWETIATIPSTSGASPEALADFITRIMNDYLQNQDLLHEAIQALECCMEEAKMTYTSENMADKVIDRFKSRCS